MKFCSKCGNELFDEATFCPKCVCPTNYNQQIATKTNDNSGLKTATKIFMIIGCFCMAFFYLIPLCWCIPMTIIYFKKVKNNEPISVGFKICSLLFVSLIGGVLMLRDNE